MLVGGTGSHGRRFPGAGGCAGGGDVAGGDDTRRGEGRGGGGRGLGARGLAKIGGEAHVVLLGAGGGIKTIRAAELVNEAKGLGRAAPEVVAAGLALVGVDAEAGLAGGLRDTLDVTLAKGLDAVGTGAGRLIGVEGLTTVEATEGRESLDTGSLDGGESREGHGEEGGAHVDGGLR